MELDDSGHFSLVERGHYSVVVAVNQSSVWLIDGTSGSLHELPSADFQRKWTGYVVCAAPEHVAGWLKIVIFGNLASFSV